MVLTNKNATFDGCHSNLEKSLKVSVVETSPSAYFRSGVALVRPGIGQHGIFVVEISDRRGVSAGGASANVDATT
jgi:hypothetical protein